MVTTPTQEELEQPVKGYQLQAVQVELEGVNKKLDKVITQTSGLVTCAQLDATKKEIFETVELKYGAKIKFQDKIFWLVAGTAITGVVTSILQWALGGGHG